MNKHNQNRLKYSCVYDKTSLFRDDFISIGIKKNQI